MCMCVSVCVCACVHITSQAGQGIMRRARLTVDTVHYMIAAGYLRLTLVTMVANV